MLALTPGSLSYAEREPGTHCLRMCQNICENLRKTVRLLLPSTWFMYIYIVYQFVMNPVIEPVTFDLDPRALTQHTHRAS